jgi:two-component system sensor kinase FixL
MTDESRNKHLHLNANDRSDQQFIESIAGNFAEFLESMPDGIITTDTSGTMVLVNSQAEKLLGYEPGGLILRKIETVVPVRFREGHSSLRDSYIANPYPRPMGQGVMIFGLRRDGSEFPAEISLSPMHSDAGLLICAAIRDITEQKRMAEDLRAQQSELTHAARLSTLGEMAAGLAHELNQPLTAMSAYAEGALERLDRGKLPETEIASVFSRIAEDAQRAGDIIRRLRNFVQKREAQRHQIDINRLVRDVYNLVASEAKHQGITIQFELASDLPAVEADPIEIQQVLLNLIRNASDALARSDFAERKIVISSHEEKSDRVEVVVEDSGPGISDSIAERVFEPFYTSKADGLGIGLGICQNIIEAHGGKMWLGRSSMGGAGVYFDLPLYHQEDKSDES